MHILNTAALPLATITDFASVGAHVAPLGSRADDVHISFLRFDPPGVINLHPAGFHQFFVVLSGAGWITGGDGVRHPLKAGQIAFVRRGENHAKGSDVGMTALIVQLRELTTIPRAAAV
jgi:quercetin dioxygenase-like cupin family protein